MHLPAVWARKFSVPRGCDALRLKHGWPHPHVQDSCAGYPWYTRRQIIGCTFCWRNEQPMKALSHSRFRSLNNRGDRYPTPLPGAKVIRSAGTYREAATGGMPRDFEILRKSGQPIRTVPVSFRGCFSSRRRPHHKAISCSKFHD
jgi:hypothetical protein